MAGSNNIETDGSMPPDSDARKAERSCRCSFCGKDQNEALLLVAGPDAYICDECIAKAHQIVQDVKAEKARDLQPPE